MTEFGVYFEKYNIFSERVECKYDYVIANSEPDAGAMCRWKHGENISILNICEEE